MEALKQPGGQAALPDGIFREYDIRGIAGNTLTEDGVYRIARAFASDIVRAEGPLPRAGEGRGEADHGEGASPCICLSRDGRISSPELARAAARGMADAGVNVIDIGLGPTPMLYFASHRLQASGGIMITGSHNPADHNGMKFMLRGEAFFGGAIRALKRTAEAGDFASGKGSVQSKDISESYLAELLRAYEDARPLRIAWDAGNGATGEVMEALAQRLPGIHVTLNAAIDGTFPIHHPDPTVPENLQQLIDTVRREGLDAGIAFDGDGDRIGVVDNEGEIIWGDQLMVFFAGDVLRRHPRATVIADVKASNVLFEEITRMGGTPMMWKTGHSHIKARMKETGAKLAGEMSGHIFFADNYYGYDDGLYAAVRLLSIIARAGCPLSELRKSLPRRESTPEIRFLCDDARKFAVVAEVKARLKAAGAGVNDIDGVRVTMGDGWWLLRASNTQPMLVARCEGADGPALERLKAALAEQLRLSGLTLP